MSLTDIGYKGCKRLLGFPLCPREGALDLALLSGVWITPDVRPELPMTGRALPHRPGHGTMAVQEVGQW